MAAHQEGIEGEQWLLKEFIRKGIKCFQPDAISLENGEFIINEVKYQERFTPPPFEGHGLPKWQVETRIGFWRITGMRIRLIIKEKRGEKTYWQWLDILESGIFLDTKGVKPRRIYPLGNFNVWDL